MNKPACMVWLPMDHRLLGDPGHTMPYLVLGDKYARAVKRCADAQPVLFPLAEAQQIPALLALVDGHAAGCVALRPLADVDYPNACEMKRLFVRRAFRRFGLGRLLAQGLLDRAVESGYSSLLLDTLDDMEAARELYASLGFVEVPPYYFNPIAGAHYLKVDLAAGAGRR